MNKLILTVGLPRSGKSTWARRQGVPVVNLDSIRLAWYGKAFDVKEKPSVWWIARCMVTALFLAGHKTVILDATNTTRDRRANWLSYGSCKLDKLWELEYKLFKAPKETCIRRAEKTGKPELIPVIEKMAEELEWPADYEYR
jgi:predicted kinase